MSINGIAAPWIAKSFHLGESGIAGLFAWISLSAIGALALSRMGRKPRSRKSEYQSYIFRIEDSETGYSLAIDRHQLAEGPYWEHLEFSLRGTIVAPERVRSRQGTLTFLGDRRITRDLDSPPVSPSQPLCVGTLTIWGETTSYLGSLPHDALWHLIEAVGRGGIHMVALHREALYRGKAKILTVHFGREINPEDW